MLKGDSFSVDIMKDYLNAKQRMKKDKFLKCINCESIIILKKYE